MVSPKKLLIWAAKAASCIGCIYALATGAYFSAFMFFCSLVVAWIIGMQHEEEQKYGKTE